jgi:predicted NAD/FAD-dependent oxidoreductase
MKKPKIIILGAGMSGISCALSLCESFDVHVYEKSRGVGGRLCAKTLIMGYFILELNSVKLSHLAYKIFL